MMTELGHFLRHVIWKDKIVIDPAKIEMMKYWKAPKNVIKVRISLVWPDIIGDLWNDST